MTRKKQFLLALLIFIVGIVIGAHYRLFLGNIGVGYFAHKAADVDIREVKRSDTALTSPLLECSELSASVSDDTLSTLHADVQKLVDTGTKNGNISYASVYFRDLNNGPWFGINESDEFFPASLLKLPLAMSFYDHAEDDPTLMDKKVTYTPDPSTATQTQPFGPKNNIEKGKQYTVKELLDTMLQESSNEAAVTLASVAGQDQIMSIYHDLGLKPPTFGKDYLIDTHRYASFFRVLYNATYLDRNASEKILFSLTETSFQEGLVAGVPKGVTVAHKFGSRQVDDAGKVQLHDCGIVYAKDKPYILCVMTQGTDFTKLAAFIKNVSSAVYSQVTAH